MGTDIVEIKRMEKAIQRESFLQKVFTENERAWLKTKGKNMAQSAAGLFCAKEAIVKAVGTGFSDGLGAGDIEIGHTELGAPYVVRPHRRFLLSISHCKEYAIATAILLENETNGGGELADH